MRFKHVLEDVFIVYEEAAQKLRKRKPYAPEVLNILKRSLCWKEAREVGKSQQQPPPGRCVTFSVAKIIS